MRTPIRLSIDQGPANGRGWRARSEWNQLSRPFGRCGRNRRRIRSTRLGLPGGRQCTAFQTCRKPDYRVVVRPTLGQADFHYVALIARRNILRKEVKSLHLLTSATSSP